MKTIRIKLPDELERDLIALAPDKAAFITKAVQEKIEKEKKEQLKKQWTEGCQGALGEDPNVTKGFEPADVEYWQ
jgi:post-segregation antitoxin (ccd killing protein)